MATKPMEIAKVNADVIINCTEPKVSSSPAILNLTSTTARNDPADQKRSFLVSSAILSSACEPFNAMFNHGFSESIAPSPSAHRNVSLEDDPHALQIIFSILHYRNQLVPRVMAIEQLYNISSVVDKYNLFEALLPWLDIWCRKIAHKIGVDGTNDEMWMPEGSKTIQATVGKSVKHSDSRWLSISWICRRGPIFRQETEYYMPRLRMMTKEEAFAYGEQEGTLTVARRGDSTDGMNCTGGLGDKKRWVVNPLAGLSDKILEELWEVRQQILDPVVKRLRLFLGVHQQAARKADGSTVCVLQDMTCDLIASGIAHMIFNRLEVRDPTNDKDVEEAIGRFSIFDVARIIRFCTNDALEGMSYHKECHWMADNKELNKEVLQKFKGLEPWGSTRKDKY